MTPPTVYQLYQQGMQLARAGWSLECMGNPAAAGAHYQQALQAFDACGRIRAPQPLDRLFWVGSCQLRLGCLCQFAGNVAWAGGWFQMARASLQQASQLDPANAAARALLGQFEPPTAPSPQQQPAKGGTPSGWDLAKKGLEALPKLFELFKGSGDQQNANANANPPPAADWSGFSGMGGWDGGMGWGGDAGLNG
jgi:hypothetical protein